MDNEQEIYHTPVSPDSVIMRSVIKKAPPLKSTDVQLSAPTNKKVKIDADVVRDTVITTDLRDDVDDMDVDDGDGKSTDITSTEEAKGNG